MMTTLSRHSSGATPAASVAAADHRLNNFDLIRLLAAAQVAVVHAGEHLEALPPKVIMWLGLFPGVPIFFFVSGFLISQAVSRTVDYKEYARNRIIRVFPALWACLIFSVALVSVFQPIPWTKPEFVAWIAAQASIAQFYNPEFFRDFGLGVVNGSLWTIPVELQFYIALPIFLFLTMRLGSWLFWTTLGLALAAHSIFLYMIYGNEGTIAKLIAVSLAPWFGLFMLGVAVNRLWPRIDWLFRGKLHLWLIVYMIAAIPAVIIFEGRVTGNKLPLPLCIILAGVVISFAYSATSMSRLLLNGRDISYGLYLFHGHIINASLEASERNWLQLSSGATFGSVLALSVAMALASWHAIERPALSLKRRRAVLSETGGLASGQPAAKTD